MSHRRKKRNYSGQAVKFEDGSILEHMNFSQETPDTMAIQGRNLTFRHCNLVNVRLHPSWTVERCNTAEIRTEEVEAEGVMRRRRYFRGRRLPGVAGLDRVPAGGERMDSDEEVKPRGHQR